MAPSEDETIDERGGFEELGLRPELVSVLRALGYEGPTPIQREAVPPLLERRDLVGQAATGTGKTAAFALPLLHRLAPDGRDPEPHALVLVPTRELAMQVADAVQRYGRDLGVRVLAVYGGQAVGRQLWALERGVDVVVATPGRALDHLRRGSLRLDRLETVVLDEADEMLDMGFVEDIEAILEHTPAHRQTVLFSATIPPRIEGLVRRHLRDPVRIQIRRPVPVPDAVPVVRQVAYVVTRNHKPAALARVLAVESPTAALVFCRTRDEVDRLTTMVAERGHRAESLHGGITQDQREKVMARFRTGATELLIATDVAARGIDVEHLTHVVNYDVPSSPDAYVHRIGRVGRAGRAGVAITIAEPREQRMLQAIEAVTEQRIAIERLPTVADLRERRLERTREALQESLERDDLEQFRAVVESLAEEADLMDVALAAVRLAHESLESGAEDAEEIPQRDPEASRPRRDGPPAAPRPSGEGMARLWVGLGREAGVRPQDLVGAIANESGISGRSIGGIQIEDRFSLVEVPAGDAQRVIDALRGTTIKGRKANVRRDRHGDSDGRGRPGGGSRSTRVRRSK